MYRIFTPEDLDEIEAEAMALRMKQTARQRANVYDALYKEAVKGDVPACREFLDRTEGKVTDKVSYESTVKQQDMVINIFGVKADPEKVEEQRKRIEAIGSETKWQCDHIDLPPDSRINSGGRSPR